MMRDRKELAIELLKCANANFASHKSVTPRMAWNGIRQDEPGLLEARSAFNRHLPGDMHITRYGPGVSGYSRAVVFKAFDAAINEAEANDEQ